jgi:hypothetical protein
MVSGFLGKAEQLTTLFYIYIQNESFHFRIKISSKLQNASLFLLSLMLPSSQVSLLISSHLSQAFTLAAALPRSPLAGLRLVHSSPSFFVRVFVIYILFFLCLFLYEILPHATFLNCIYEGSCMQIERLFFRDNFTKGYPTIALFHLRVPM